MAVANQSLQQNGAALRFFGVHRLLGGPGGFLLCFRFPFRQRGVLQMAPSSGDYVELRTKAAKWLLENKDRATWWDWPVLTSSNPDPTTPGIPEIVAFTDSCAMNVKFS
jgi:hypothetical protein